MNRIPRLLIDTDTASDDAVALLMAAAASADGVATIEAVTVVAGNVALRQATANALIMLELARMTDVPVHPGCDRPLLRDFENAEHVHGPDGMGDAGLPAARRDPEEEHAVDAIIRLVRQSPGELTLVTLGPLTNIAAALVRAPQIATQLADVFVMGGAADGVGNVSAVAEFNVWADPEAAEVVFRSGAPLTMVGWDVSRRYAVMRPEDQARLEAIGTERSHLVNRINRTLATFCASVTKLEGYDLPDPITMAITLDPSLARRTERLGVTIDTSHTRTRGMTIVDRLGIDGVSPNVNVVWEADELGFKELLYRACAGASASDNEKEE